MSIRLENCLIIMLIRCDRQYILSGLQIRSYKNINKTDAMTSYERQEIATIFLLILQGF